MAFEVRTLFAFNGSIQSIDKSTGQEASVFVVSIEATNPVFSAINLAQVDPRACFTPLGGTLSDHVAAPTPVVAIRLQV